MFAHQLGQDLILALDLLLQILDAFLLRRMAVAGLSLKSGRPVLEEFLLPAVEDRRLEAQFVTEFGYRLVLQEMPPQDGDLLLGCVMLSCLFHAFSPLS